MISILLGRFLPGFDIVNDRIPIKSHPILIEFAKTNRGFSWFKVIPGLYLLSFLFGIQVYILLFWCFSLLWALVVSYFRFIKMKDMSKKMYLRDIRKFALYLPVSVIGICGLTLFHKQK